MGSTALGGVVGLWGCRVRLDPLKRFVCLFGEGARARSIVAEASGMAQKTVARTSFEATRDLARPDNTALLGAAPLP